MPFVNTNLLAALAVCLGGILFEALCAGTGIKSYMQQLNWPAFSPPVWAWYVIGVAYYVISFICACRLLGQPATVLLRNTALVFLLLLIVPNALWNLLFFRAKKLGATFVFSLGYSAVVVLCLYCLIRLDQLAAWALGIYFVYLIYANIWAYRLWRFRSA